MERKARVPGGLSVLKKAPQGLPVLARAFPKSISLRPPSAKPPVVSGPIETSDSRPAPLRTVTSPPAPAPEPPPGPDPLAPRPDSPPMPGSEVVPFGSEPPPLPASTPVKVDLAVQPAQALKPPGFPDDFSAQPVPDQVPFGDQPPLAPNSVPLGPSSAPPVVDGPPTGLTPLPDAAPRPPALTPSAPLAPILPGSQRRTTIYPRGLGEIYIDSQPVQADGTQVLIIRNGVNIQTRSKEQGIVDIEADNVVIWRRSEGRQGPARMDMNNQFVDNNTDPLEFYLEGHVIFRQDEQKYQGKADTKAYQAERVYYDVRKDQLLAVNAELDLFAPGLVTPLKITSPKILQYHPMVAAANGQLYASSLAAMQAEQTMATGSRFANPGYKFKSRSIDINQIVDDRELAKGDGEPFDQDDLTWLIDARSNFFFFGPVPVFYLPQFKAEADNLNPR